MISRCRYLVLALGLLLPCLGLVGEIRANVSPMLRYAPNPSPGLTEAELDAWAAKVRSDDRAGAAGAAAEQRRFDIRARIANTLIGLYFACGAIRVGLRVRRGKPVALGVFFYLVLGLFVVAALGQGKGPTRWSYLDEAGLNRRVEEYRHNLRRAATKGLGGSPASTVPVEIGR